MEHIAIVATALGAGLLTWQLTWPDWQVGTQRQERIAELNQKVGDLAQAEAALTRQTERLAAVQLLQTQQCREIPETADVAGLMQALSLDVDGSQVRDQTFTVVDRPSREAERFEVLPVQIEMEAGFEQVWSVLERAERQPRLLRVAGIDVSLAGADAASTDVQAPLRASIAVDVVYAPSEGDVLP